MIYCTARGREEFRSVVGSGLCTARVWFEGLRSGGRVKEFRGVRGGGEG